MRLLRAVTGAGLAVAMMGCTELSGILEETTEDAMLAALATTWNATQFEFTNVANPTQTYDVIASGGSLTITVAADGRYSGQIAMGGGTETLAGTMQVQGNTLIMTEDDEPGDPMTAAFAVTATTLTLTFDDQFDFDQDGTDESAAVEIVLERA